MEPKFCEELLPHIDLFESGLGSKAVNLSFEFYGLSGDFHKGQVMDSLEPGESQKIEEAMEKIIIAGNEKDVFEQCIHKWKFKELERKEKNIIDMLSLADAEENHEASDRLTKQLMAIRKEMEAHGGRI